MRLRSRYKFLSVTIMAALLAISDLPVIAQSRPFLKAPMKTTFATIGGDSLMGVSYPVANSIAKYVNDYRSLHGIRLTANLTDSSVNTIRLVLSGELEFGIVSSVAQYQAFSGKSTFRDHGSNNVNDKVGGSHDRSDRLWQKPQKELRSMFSIQTQAVTVVIADDTNIATLNDLIGMEVDAGAEGSERRKHATDVVEIGGGYELSEIVLKKIPDENDILGLFDSHQIDAFFITVQHPYNLIEKVIGGKRNASILEIPNIQRIVAHFPYYVATEINLNEYKNAASTGTIKTVGVRTTLITSTKVSDELAYSVTKSVFTNHEKFKKLHPNYKNLTKQGMLEGLSAEIHPGAMRYYEEAGLK